ncbi:MAG: thiol reductant ABC exporter subunit CydD [Pseudomonadota bacterium]
MPATPLVDADDPDARRRAPPSRAPAQTASAGASDRDFGGSEQEIAAASDAARLDALIAAQKAELRLGAIAQAGAAALWPLQALFLAFGLQGLIDPWKGVSALIAATGFVAIAVLRAWLDAWGAERCSTAAEAAKQAIRARLLSAMALWSPTDAARPNAGAIAALAAEGLEALEPYLTRYEPARLKLLTIPPLILLAVAPGSMTVAAILLVCGPLIPILLALVGVAAKRAADRQLSELSAMNAFLLERIRALPDLRLLDAVGRVADGFDHAADRLRARTMAVLKIAFLSSAAIELCAGAGIALTALTVVSGLIQEPGFAAAVGLSAEGAFVQILANLPGDAPGELSTALFLMLLAPEFFQPFREFAGAYHDRAAAMALSARLGAALHRRGPRMLGAGTPAPPLPGPASIRFDAVAFRYGEGAPALSELSFEIRSGEWIGLAGPSGAGKSTVLALIAGLAAPSAGRILVSDQVLDDAVADAWRARLAWTEQKPHFPAGALAANVALIPPIGPAAGRTLERRDRRVRQALEIARAAELADRPPYGLARPIGETGVGLSGGEARRVALARLAYADRDVLLADEPTADLDADTREAVIDGLTRIAEGRTLIVASHDPTLLDRMDRVIDLGRAAPTEGAPTGGEPTGVAP